MAEIEERIEFEDGELDEICVTGGAHLENMGGNDWFLEMIKEDGSSIAIWFYSKSLRKPFFEMRVTDAALREPNEEEKRSED